MREDSETNYWTYYPKGCSVAGIQPGFITPKGVPYSWYPPTLWKVGYPILNYLTPNLVSLLYNDTEKVLQYRDSLNKYRVNITVILFNTRRELYKVWYLILPTKSQHAQQISPQLIKLFLNYYVLK